MKITVLDRVECIRRVNGWLGYEPIEEKVLIISISCIDDKPAYFQSRKGLIDVHLFFDDVEGDDKHCVPMDANDAFVIVDWVNRYKNFVDQIIVSCNGGYSRSPAVAAALSKWLNGSDEEFFGPDYCPNRHVYRLMMNELERRGFIGTR